MCLSTVFAAGGASLRQKSTPRTYWIGDERFRRSEKRLPRIVPANLAGMTAKGPDAAQKKGENIGRMIVRIESALARAKIYGVLRRPHKGAPERFGVAFNDVAGLANHVWLFG